MAELPEKVHIHAPELLTRPQRTRDAVVTAAMWVFYLYLWVPLLSLFAWLLGFEFAYDAMIRAGGIEDLRAVSSIYAVIIGMIFVVVTAWSVFNRVRFRGMERRRFATPVTDEQLIEHFGISREHLRALRRGKNVRAELDEHGRLTRVDGATAATD